MRKYNGPAPISPPWTAPANGAVRSVCGAAAVVCVVGSAYGIAHDAYALITACGGVLVALGVLGQSWEALAARAPGARVFAARSHWEDAHDQAARLVELGSVDVARDLWNAHSLASRHGDDRLAKQLTQETWLLIQSLTEAEARGGGDVERTIELIRSVRSGVEERAES